MHVTIMNLNDINLKYNGYKFQLYTGKISPPFYFRPFRPLAWGRIQNWANWKIYKEVCNKIEEEANSKLGESISDPYRAKIRLGEFKAVYSNAETCSHCT